jgi:hypothetical protein
MSRSVPVWLGRQCSVHRCAAMIDDKPPSKSDIRLPSEDL